MQRAARLLRFFFLIFPLAANATETAAPAVSAGTYVQTGLALSLIVALLIGTAWLAKKISGGKSFGQGGIKIVGGVTLGPRERIVLLEVGDEWIVVGIVPGQIRTLHRLEKGTTLDAEGLAVSAEKPFTQWLQAVTERRKHD